MTLREGAECLDGGTGSFLLLEAMQRAKKVILVDATVDGSTLGAVHRLFPRFSKDYPRTLTAHDIGLKDLLDAFYLLGSEPAVTLFAVSILPPAKLRAELSPHIAAAVPHIPSMVVDSANRALERLKKKSLSMRYPAEVPEPGSG